MNWIVVYVRLAIFWMIFNTSNNEDIIFIFCLAKTDNMIFSLDFNKYEKINYVISMKEIKYHTGCYCYQYLRKSVINYYRKLWPPKSNLCMWSINLDQKHFRYNSKRSWRRLERLYRIYRLIYSKICPILTLLNRMKFTVVVLYLILKPSFSHWKYIQVDISFKKNILLFLSVT